MLRSTVTHSSESGTPYLVITDPTVFNHQLWGLREKRWEILKKTLEVLQSEPTTGSRTLIVAFLAFPDRFAGEVYPKFAENVAIHLAEHLGGVNLASLQFGKLFECLGAVVVIDAEH